MKIKNILNGDILLYPVLFLLLSAFAACDKNPVNRLVNPTTTNTAGAWSGTWVIYDDELKTNGAVMAYNEGAIIDFNCSDNPHTGKKCIRYSWDGSPVLTYASLTAGATVQSGFSGFGLICAQTIGTYSTGTRDLSPGGYTKITFWARGSLNTDVHLRLEDNGANSQTASGTDAWLSDTAANNITADWQKFSFTVSPSSLVNAKDFVRIILVYSGTGAGNGGTVYLDDIQLTK